MGSYLASDGSARSASGHVCEPLGTAHALGRLPALHAPAPRLDYPRLTVRVSELPSRVGRFLRLGLPGALMLALEAWAFELSTLMAAYLGTVSLDAHVSLLNIISFTFLSCPFALGIAASIRVGQLLGAAKVEAAKAVAGFTLAAILAIMCAHTPRLLEGGQDPPPSTAFQTPPPSTRCTLGHEDRLPGLACYIFMTTAPATRCEPRVGRPAPWPHPPNPHLVPRSRARVGGGSLPDPGRHTGGRRRHMRGMGRQTLVAWLNFGGFWVVGLSVGASLTFGLQIGVVGLWWGLAAGLATLPSVSFSLGRTGAALKDACAWAWRQHP